METDSEFTPAIIAPGGRSIFTLRAAGSDREIGLARGRRLAEDLRRMWAWMSARMDTTT